MTVACLVPTIPAHSQFIDPAVESLYAQVYPSDWDVLIRIDGAQGSLGNKLNAMVQSCLDANPETGYFVLTDSDDIHHPDRIRKQVQPLIDTPKLLITGTSILVYQDVSNGEVWQYRGLNSTWIGGLAFRVDAWKAHHFEDISAGTDTNWQRKFAPDTKLDLLDGSLMLCGIHAANTCRKHTVGREWSRLQ